MSSEYKPRFGFEITEEQQRRANTAFPTYGLRKAIFSIILDEVMDIIETYGGPAIGILLTGKAKPSDIIPTMNKATKVKEGN
jgi:hypothetical protein